MTEPVLDYSNPDADTTWYDWLCAKDDAQLQAYWQFIRNWAPSDDPAADPDAMQLKYELTAQLMDERGL